MSLHTRGYPHRTVECNTLFFYDGFDLALLFGGLGFGGLGATEDLSENRGP